MGFNEGFLNEDRLMYCIDGKKFDQLNGNLQHFISLILPYLDKEKPIKCCKAEPYTKPDICIYQGNQRVFVSVKHGTTEILHDEKINPFINFLREQGIDEDIINGYLLYHYGDGTTDGTGETRLAAFDARVKYDAEVRKVNEAFNKSKDFIKEFADRVMFKGVNPDAEGANVLYHGDEDYGSFISRNQLMRHLERRSYDFMTQNVHIGPFIVRPRARYPGKEIKNDDHRHKIVVSYPRLLNEVMYISGRYKF